MIARLRRDLTTLAAELDRDPLNAALRTRKRRLTEQLHDQERIHGRFLLDSELLDHGGEG